MSPFSDVVEIADDEDEPTRAGPADPLTDVALGIPAEVAAAGLGTPMEEPDPGRGAPERAARPAAPISVEEISEPESDRDEDVITNLYQMPNRSLVRAENKIHIPSVERPDTIACNRQRFLRNYRIVDEDIEDVNPQRLCPTCVTLRPNLFPDQAALFHIEQEAAKARARASALAGTGKETYLEQEIDRENARRSR